MSRFLARSRLGCPLRRWTLVSQALNLSHTSSHRFRVSIATSCTHIDTLQSSSGSNQRLCEHIVPQDCTSALFHKATLCLILFQMDLSHHKLHNRHRHNSMGCQWRGRDLLHIFDFESNPNRCQLICHSFKWVRTCPSASMTLHETCLRQSWLRA